MLFYLSFPILESEVEEGQGGHYVFGFFMFAFLIVKRDGEEEKREICILGFGLCEK